VSSKFYILFRIVLLSFKGKHSTDSGRGTFKLLKQGRI